MTLTIHECQPQTPTTMKTYTYNEIANDYRLWQEYADQGGFDSEAAFNDKTEAEKVSFLTSCFGDEQQAAP